MIIAALTFVFVWCLFYGKVPQPYLLLICIGLGIFLAFQSRHKHTQFLSIDVLAQSSRLKLINPTLKFWTVLALMFVCVASKNIYTGVFLMCAMFTLTVFVGKMRLHNYISVMALPVSFLLIGGIALLFEITAEPMGVLNFNLLGVVLTVSEKTQTQTALVISRAFGAVSCLCFLSMTTPMPDIIAVLRRARCPNLLIDLMYLIYRYIFILLSLHHEMRNAAKSRLGFKNYRTSLRAVGKIYANLLARSYQFAGTNFDAMESRCYDTGIRFLVHEHKVTLLQISVSGVLLITSVGISLLAL